MTRISVKFLQSKILSLFLLSLVVLYPVISFAQTHIHEDLTDEYKITFFHSHPFEREAENQEEQHLHDIDFTYIHETYDSFTINLYHYQLINHFFELPSFFENFLSKNQGPVKFQQKLLIYLGINPTLSIPELNRYLL